MSYCRWGENGSDVYVYKSFEGQFVCMDMDHDTVVVDTEQQMIDHLLHHREGHDHSVPQEVFDRLEAERDGKPYQTALQRALKEFE